MVVAGRAARQTVECRAQSGLDTERGEECYSYMIPCLRTSENRPESLPVGNIPAVETCTIVQTTLKWPVSSCSLNTHIHKLRLTLLIKLTKISWDLLQNCLTLYQQAVKAAKTENVSSLVSTNAHKPQAF